MKPILARTLVLTAFAVIVLMLGCTDRGENYNMSGPTWEDNLILSGPSPMEHVFFDELLLQTRNKLQLMKIVAYIPGVTQSGQLEEDPEPLPLLILLPPQDGSAYYYFNHGLKQIADELITRGIIEPMIIASIENDPIFGGYFYAGGGSARYVYDATDFTGASRTGEVSASPGSGAYDDIVGDALIDVLRIKTLGRIVNDPEKWGIGGVGMGAYGAFRAAMLHPGTFGSISATDGPLDFDGADGSSGLMDLVDQVFAEQNIAFGDVSAYKNFDTSGAWHASRMFVGGSIAFSPLDTLAFVTAFAFEPTEGGPWLQKVRVDSTLRIDTAGAPTAITSLVIESQETNADFDFLLPFDANGNFVNDVWNQKWLPNNLENLFQSESGAQSAIENADIWFGSSAEARFGFHDMTQSWYNTIAAAHPNNSNDTLVWFDYDGYAGYGASHDQYIYDLLREMLIFHDHSFKKESQLP